jgi:hypothetical protein
MKRFLSNWQGLTALLAAAGCFILSRDLIHELDPSAGVFDLGYLQRPLVAAAYFFFGTFCAWAALQIDLPTVDKWVDRKHFEKAWESLPDERKIGFIGKALVVLLAAYLVCLALVPV